MAFDVAADSPGVSPANRIGHVGFFFCHSSCGKLDTLLWNTHLLAISLVSSFDGVCGMEG